MADFVMLTRLTHGALTSPSSLENLEREVMDRLHAECPDVEWKQSYAVLGPYDYLDIFSAPDIDTATKVATIVRTFGHAHISKVGRTSLERDFHGSRVSRGIPRPSVQETDDQLFENIFVPR